MAISKPPSVNISRYRLVRGIKASTPMKTKARIPEEGKQFGSLPKKVLIHLTPQGIKVDFIAGFIALIKYYNY